MLRSINFLKWPLLLILSTIAITFLMYEFNDRTVNLPVVHKYTQYATHKGNYWMLAYQNGIDIVRRPVAESVYHDVQIGDIHPVILSPTELGRDLFDYYFIAMSILVLAVYVYEILRAFYGVSINHNSKYRKS